MKFRYEIKKNFPAMKQTGSKSVQQVVGRDVKEDSLGNSSDLGYFMRMVDRMQVDFFSQLASAGIDILTGTGCSSPTKT